MTQNHLARLLKQSIRSSVPAFPVMKKFCVLCSTEFQKGQRRYRRINLNSSTDDTGTSVLTVLEEAGVEINCNTGFLCLQCLSPLKKLKKAQDKLDTISKN